MENTVQKWLRSTVQKSLCVRYWRSIFLFIVFCVLFLPLETWTWTWTFLPSFSSTKRKRSGERTVFRLSFSFSFSFLVTHREEVKKAGGRRQSFLKKREFFLTQFILKSLPKGFPWSRTQNRTMALNQNFATMCVHVGSEPDPMTGAVVPPISLATTFAQNGLGQLHGL